MASDIHNTCCLVCSSVISSSENFYLDKLEALFLLKILLQIPQDNPIISQIQSTLTFLPVCQPCGSTVKQCKQSYTEMSAQVQNFWLFQDSILRKLNTSKEPYPNHHKSNKYNNWVNQCIQFVKNHNFQTFRYPFVFHDLSKLLNSIPDAYPSTIPFTYTTNVAPNSFGGPMPFGQYLHHPASLSLSSFNNQLEVPSHSSIQINDPFHDTDKDYDISDQEECSEPDDNSSQPEFQWNPITGRFHCLDPSCSKTAGLKKHIEAHFLYHSNTLAQPKTNFVCDWPSCGKSYKKEVNFQSHLDKHRGTPSIKCTKCGKLFYYPKGLQFHQTRKCGLPRTLYKWNTLKNYDQHLTPIPKIKPFFKNTKTGRYHCHYQLCSESLRTREEMRQHLLVHAHLQNQSILANPNLRSNIEVPATMTSGVNYYEGNSQSESDPLEEMPSSSGSSLRSPFSPAVELGHTFMAENEKIILKGTPEVEFENEDDEQDDYEDEEDLHQNSKLCEPTSIISNDKADDDLKGVACTWPGCGTRLCDKTHLSGHMDKHRGIPRQKCETCGQLFYWRADLLSHQEKEHGKKEDKANNNQRSGTNLEDRILNRIPSSSQTDSLTNTNCSDNPRQIVIKIIRKKDTIDCKVEEQSSDEYSGLSNSNEFAQEINMGHLSTNMEWKDNYSEDNFRQDPITGKYLCLEESCSKTSVSKQYIFEHFEVEHLKTREKKSFSCDWPGCGKMIGDKQTFTAHLNKHKGTPEHECEICGVTFYWRKGLIRHYKSKHGEIRGVKKKDKLFCEMTRCRAKKFENREEWQEHMKKHKECLKESCGGCGQRFNWRLELIEHQQQFGH